MVALGPGRPDRRAGNCSGTAAGEWSRCAFRCECSDRSVRRLLERVHDPQLSELLTVLQVLGEQDGTIGAHRAAATIMKSQNEYRQRLLRRFARIAVVDSCRVGYPAVDFSRIGRPARYCVIARS